MAPSKSATPKSPDVTHINLTCLVGEVARDAVLTETQDGRTFASFDVVCRVDGERTVVPVSQEGGETPLAAQTVLVLGKVNKRFYASGTGLASRTDVRADKVVVVRRRDQVARALKALAGDLLGD